MADVAVFPTIPSREASTTKPVATQLVAINPVSEDRTTSDIAYLDTPLKAPFDAIRQLFDHLRKDPADAEALNATYPSRGVFKSAAVRNGSSDQKLTIDLSPSRLSFVPDLLRAALAPHGLEEVLHFFTQLTARHLESLLNMLSAAGGAGDLTPSHRARNVNFRLCDYTPNTAAPESENGCGAHCDYGTFSIIFQDGTSGLEVESPDCPRTWLPVPSDKVVVLCGWSAFVLSGGELRAVRHRWVFIFKNHIR